MKLLDIHSFYFSIAHNTYLNDENIMILKQKMRDLSWIIADKLRLADKRPLIDSMTHHSAFSAYKLPQKQRMTPFMAMFVVLWKAIHAIGFNIYNKMCAPLMTLFVSLARTSTGVPMKCNYLLF